MFLPKLGTQVVISWPRQSVLKLLPNILEDWDDKATGVSEGNGDEREGKPRILQMRSIFHT